MYPARGNSKIYKESQENLVFYPKTSIEIERKINQYFFKHFWFCCKTSDIILNENHFVDDIKNFDISICKQINMQVKQ